MKDFSSPEEKLLRLIRGQKKQPQAVENIKAVPLNSQKQHGDFPAVAATAAASRKRFPGAGGSGYYLWRKIISFLSIQKMLSGIFFLACLYLLVSLFYPWAGLKNISLQGIEPSKVGRPITDLQTTIKPYEFYLEGTKNRKLFGAISSGSGQMPESGASLELIKDISLMGIISGDQPQAILEDTKTQKTYYCVKGQFVGDFQIEDIQEGKIIIKFKDRLFELYL